MNINSTSVVNGRVFQLQADIERSKFKLGRERKKKHPYYESSNYERFFMEKVLTVSSSSVVKKGIFH